MNNVVDIRTRRFGRGERCPHGRIRHACAECVRADGDRELAAHIQTMKEALALAQHIERLIEDPHTTVAAAQAASDMQMRAVTMGMGALLTNDKDDTP